MTECDSYAETHKKNQSYREINRSRDRIPKSPVDEIDESEREI